MRRRRVKTYSVAELMAEVDKELASMPEGEIRTVTIEELREMQRRGELGQTRPDAEEIELDDSFWENARWQPPLFPPERPRPKKGSKRQQR